MILAGGPVGSPAVKDVIPGVEPAGSLDVRDVIPRGARGGFPAGGLADHRGAQDGFPAEGSGCIPVAPGVPWAGTHPAAGPGVVQGVLPG